MSTTFTFYFTLTFLLVMIHSNGQQPDFYLVCTDNTVWVAGDRVTLTCHIEATSVTSQCNTVSVLMENLVFHRSTVVCTGMGLNTHSPVLTAVGENSKCRSTQVDEVIHVVVTMVTRESQGDWLCDFDRSDKNYEACKSNVSTGSDDKCKDVLVETYILGMSPTKFYIIILGLCLLVACFIHIMQRYRKYKRLLAQYHLSVLERVKDEEELEEDGESAISLVVVSAPSKRSLPAGGVVETDVDTSIATYAGSTTPLYLLPFTADTGASDANLVHCSDSDVSPAGAIAADDDESATIVISNTNVTLSESRSASFSLVPGSSAYTPVNRLSAANLQDSITITIKRLDHSAGHSVDPAIRVKTTTI